MGPRALEILNVAHASALSAQAYIDTFFGVIV